VVVPSVVFMAVGHALSPEYVSVRVVLSHNGVSGIGLPVSVVTFNNHLHLDADTLLDVQHSHRNHGQAAAGSR
jgi:hypothetical protein